MLFWAIYFGIVSPISALCWFTMFTSYFQKASEIKPVPTMIVWLIFICIVSLSPCFLCFITNRCGIYEMAVYKTVLYVHVCTVLKQIIVPCDSISQSPKQIVSGFLNQLKFGKRNLWQRLNKTQLSLDINTIKGTSCFGTNTTDELTLSCRSSATWACSAEMTSLDLASMVFLPSCDSCKLLWASSQSLRSFSKVSFWLRRSPSVKKKITTFYLKDSILVLGVKNITWVLLYIDLRVWVIKSFW